MSVVINDMIYCSVDGLGVAVVLVCLRSFICRGVYVNCLCLNTSCIVTNGFPFSSLQNPLITQEKLPALPKKEATFPFHQQKKRPTYGVVEGEKGSRW
jgi:hypothetical protein